MQHSKAEEGTAQGKSDTMGPRDVAARPRAAEADEEGIVVRLSHTSIESGAQKSDEDGRDQDENEEKRGNTTSSSLSEVREEC
ncbi:hypothetical protein OBBRIDRAFT_7353 [Obba rivulosa]|uniref:Uncharacterized protein n=1 Tax=Obba rivulosa TaxID=1052685 RepID=A0A8E2J7F3_9APHY|nr:hypothetical protein OBBRIDRAFT_7353 [Obba rivulosa]